MPDFVYSGRLEILIWSIPLLVILFLGGVIWFGAHALDPYRRLPGEQQAEIQVVSLDWKWLFIYPQEGIASVNELVVPAGRPLHFTLTSASVMNAFFVPRLGSMIYTMNGMATQLSLKADQPGDYPGLSTMFSGDGFADMHFMLRAVSDADFASWVNTARQNGPTLDRAAYATLARQSRNDKPATFRAIDPVLFDAVVRQALPPAPGPTEGEGATYDVREQGGGHR
jgi:cytochrome o ubiquinol oxidase subunit 2